MAAAHPAFLDDICRILGDTQNVLRRPPSRAENAYIKQLLVMVFGAQGGPPPDPSADAVWEMGLPGGARIEHCCFAWGDVLAQWVPPEWIPPCRVWFVRDEAGGAVVPVALCDVGGVPEGKHPDLVSHVLPRVQDLFGPVTLAS